MTAKYLKQYQQDNNLAVDGIAGPQTWKSFTPAPTAVLSATSNTSSGPGGSIVEIASREIGVKEEVSGCNCGERIEVYTTGRNEAWCADFISWVYREHGTPFSGGWAHDWQLPAAISLKHWLQKNGTWHERTDLSDTPQPGDVINFNWFGDSNRSTGNHVGIVERVEGSTLYTIEGNRHNAVVQKEYPNYRQDTDIIGWGRM
ncbi:hypothetical protein CYG49_02355 [Candidatus Saccharibacteria bacterium]|nr:MAG: hypothetical protein CYG49_02355 [Candidatus Saccharibacteria bacterium]